MDYPQIYVSLMFKSVGDFDTLLPELSRPRSREDTRYKFCYTAPVQALETFFFLSGRKYLRVTFIKK